MIVDVECRDPKYNSNGITIDIEMNHPIYGWIPFTASPNDPEEYGRIIHQACLDGQFGTVAAYTPA